MNYSIPRVLDSDPQKKLPAASEAGSSEVQRIHSLTLGDKITPEQAERDGRTVHEVFQEDGKFVVTVAQGKHRQEFDHVQRSEFGDLCGVDFNAEVIEHIKTSEAEVPAWWGQLPISYDFGPILSLFPKSRDFTSVQGSVFEALKACAAKSHEMAAWLIKTGAAVTLYA